MLAFTQRVYNAASVSWRVGADAAVPRIGVARVAGVHSIWRHSSPDAGEPPKLPRSNRLKTLALPDKPSELHRPSCPSQCSLGLTYFASLRPLATSV